MVILLIDGDENDDDDGDYEEGSEHSDDNDDGDKIIVHDNDTSYWCCQLNDDF